MVPEKDDRKKAETDPKAEEQPKKPFKTPTVTDLGDLKDITLGGGGCGCGSSV